MGNVENKIMKDEKIIQKTKLHWIIFLIPVIVIVTGLVMVYVAKPFNLEPLCGYLAVLGIGAIYIITEMIRYVSSSYGVTTHRVIAKTGVLRLRIIDIPLKAIESVTVNQSILGRILGYGAVTITGTGGAREFLSDLSAPEQYREAIISLLQK